MIRIDDLGLFLRSAALGSFTAAAVEANLLPGQVAAAIKRLERELQVRLFTRTTRSLRLSAEGEQYLPTARGVLEQLALAANACAAMTRRCRAHCRSPRLRTWGAISCCRCSPSSAAYTLS